VAPLSTRQRRAFAGQLLASDGRQLQLVIAPAGAGKTTALRVLAHTWTGGGGHILGLAPSATAAAQLAEATGIPADTLHRLTWAINRQLPLPDWADRIGPKTLLLIDEAGMADTLTLAAVVHHVVGWGGRVCLVGDDQQLGAIGAGGILADLNAAHGAIRLTQLHRFADPDEAAATLHVRDGAPDALDFYTARDGSGSVTPTVCPVKIDIPDPQCADLTAIPSPPSRPTRPHVSWPAVRNARASELSRCHSGATMGALNLPRIPHNPRSIRGSYWCARGDLNTDNPRRSW
jgi:AAA domain